MKVYHGTSADNLLNILADGFDGMRGTQLWKCSAGLNYFWNPADLKRAEGLETMEEAVYAAKRMAKEAAEVSLAFAKDCRRVVFEVEIPKTKLQKDTSCQNMSGAVMSSERIPSSAIKHVWIDGESLEMFKGYFIACGMNRVLRCPVDLTPVQEKLGKIFAKSHDATCEIMEFLADIELVEYKA